MIEFDAVYYDGRSSARTAVRARGYVRSLHIAGPGLEIEVPLAQLRADAPIANAPCAIHLPGGALLQTYDHAAVQALLPRAHRLERAVHALEGRWPYALAAALVAAGFTWWCVVHGLPLAAKAVAELVPVALEAKLGEQTVATLDGGFCRASELDPGKQDALRAVFGRLTSGAEGGYSYRLEFRACRGMGANAFALPGGIVVVTDALVKIAQNDAQVAAVLAHEVGHVVHRHGLRMALQGAGLAALIGALAGDAVSITGLAVTLPTVLLQTGYSRQFEEEADSYAFRRLREVKISPRRFAEIMTLLEQGRRKRPGPSPDEKSGEPLDYFSTHPATAERIRRALESEPDR